MTLTGMKQRLSMAASSTRPAPPPALEHAAHLSQASGMKSPPRGGIPRFKHASTQIPSFLPLAASAQSKQIPGGTHAQSGVSPSQSRTHGLQRPQPALSRLPTKPRSPSLKQFGDKRAASKAGVATTKSLIPPRKAYTSIAMPTRNSGSLRLRLPSRSSSRKLASPGSAALRTPHKPGMLQGAAAVYPTPPPSAKSVVTDSTFSSALDDGSDSYTSEDNWEAASARSRRSVSSSREHMDCFGASPVTSETCPAKRPSDSDEDSDGPFQYDILLSSDECMSADSSSLAALLPPALRCLPSHCVSITPLPSSLPEEASVASRRFSLVRTETSEGTVFTREIGDAQGKRWSIRVPARGLPQDMLDILDELEQLATGFTDKPTPSPSLRIPRIVVTQSQSLDSIRKMADALEHEKPRSPGLLRPPSPISDDDDEDEYDSKSGSVPFPASSVPVESIASNTAAGQYARTQRPSLQVSEPRRPTISDKPVCDFQSNQDPIGTKPADAQGSATASSMPSESSLPCIYLPDPAPEFLAQRSTTSISNFVQKFGGKASKVSVPSPDAKLNMKVEQAGRPADKTKSDGPLKPKSALPVPKHSSPSIRPASPVDSPKPEGKRTITLPLRASAPPSSGLPTGSHVPKPSRMSRSSASAFFGFSAKPSAPAIPKQATIPAPPTTRLPQSKLRTPSFLRPKSASVPAPASKEPARGFRSRLLFRRTTPAPAVRRKSEPAPPAASLAQEAEAEAQARLKSRIGKPRPVSFSNVALGVDPLERREEPKRMSRLPSARDLLRKLR